MKIKRFGLLAAVWLICAAAYSLSGSALAAPNFGNVAFTQLWNYSDKAVDEGTGSGRGYTWGPNSFGVMEEAYQQGTNGKRLVQYFDKSRMELAPDGHSVTNGLLAKELISGLRQDGDNSFTPLAPSQTPVAGDNNTNETNPNAPTYASFNSVATLTYGQNRAQNQTGQIASLSIDRSGTVNTLTNPPAQIILGYYEPTLGHNVPKVFQDYENLSGVIWNGNSYVQGAVFTTNPVANVFGYPITEPYWVKTKVAGVQKDVLVQLFERRVLTYTPSNPDAFKVEMGNIGQHYYQWRYSNNNQNTPTPYWKPAVNTTWQWQLTETPNLSVNAQVYDIDLNGVNDNPTEVTKTVAQLHALGRHAICYIDVGSWEDFRSDANAFPASVLGKVYVGYSNEKWLDIRQLNIIGPIMEKRFDLCKSEGFDAIEADNIDGYANDTGFPLTNQDQLVYNRWLTDQAHQRGLSIGMKNDPDQINDLLPYFDWALTESCFQQGWCSKMQPFIQAGKPVFAAEYTETSIDFVAACSEAKKINFSVILKHLNLDAWVQTCP